MAAVGVRATEFGPDGFLPEDRRRSGRSPCRTWPAGRRRFRAGRAARAGARPRAGAGPRARRVRGGGRRHAWCWPRRPAGTGYDERPVLDAAGWTTLLANLDRCAARAAARGLRATLHPHVGTMVEQPAEVQRVLDGSDIGLCLDTGHLLIGGTDPVDLARRATRPDRARAPQGRRRDAGPPGCGPATRRTRRRSRPACTARSARATSTSRPSCRPLEAGRVRRLVRHGAGRGRWPRRARRRGPAAPTSGPSIDFLRGPDVTPGPERLRRADHGPGRRRPLPAAVRRGTGRRQDVRQVPRRLGDQRRGGRGPARPADRAGHHPHRRGPVRRLRAPAAARAGRRRPLRDAGRRAADPGDVLRDLPARRLPALLLPAAHGARPADPRRPSSTSSAVRAARVFWATVTGLSRGAQPGGPPRGLAGPRPRSAHRARPRLPADVLAVPRGRPRAGRRRAAPRDRRRRQPRGVRDGRRRARSGRRGAGAAGGGRRAGRGQAGTPRASSA